MISSYESNSKIIERLPQTAVVNKGRKVIWFSGDVSHEHNIILTDKSSSSDSKGLFDSGLIPENSDSNPMIFNAVGDFGYKSPNVSPEAGTKRVCYERRG